MDKSGLGDAGFPDFHERRPIGFVRCFKRTKIGLPKVVGLRLKIEAGEIKTTKHNA